jgi:hypothetical protein
MTFKSFCLSSLVAGIGITAFVLATAGHPSQVRSEDKPSAGPSHQVIACYFHRTVRCPTCKTISAYIEESVKTGFAAQMKDGRVKMVMIDFQDAKNEKYTKAYDIDGPTLVLMDVKDGKVVSWKPAPKVWSLVGKKDDFSKYVRGEVRSYLDGKPADSR